MLKKCKVVMLPTKEKAIIFKSLGDEMYLNPKYDGDGTYQHLYFLSDDEIKDGDWYIYNNELLRQFNEKTNPSAKLIKRNKKIIATNDTSLWEHDDTVPYPKTRPKYPQPSQSFIEKYVEEYNKGNIITDVLVEYEYQYHSSKEFYGKKASWVSCDKKQYNLIKETLPTCPVRETLKVNSKDNTITIKKIKDSWTREEVVELLNKYSEMIDSKIDYEAHMSACCIVPIPEWDHEKWIEENL